MRPEPRLQGPPNPFDEPRGPSSGIDIPERRERRDTPASSGEVLAAIGLLDCLAAAQIEGVVAELEAALARLRRTADRASHAHTALLEIPDSVLREALEVRGRGDSRSSPRVCRRTRATGDET